MATQPIQPYEEDDPMAIQREAAMFYGLFLRGCALEELRRDIMVPKLMIDKWLSHPGYDGDFREHAKRNYFFRLKVLAVFDELIERARLRARLQ